MYITKNRQSEETIRRMAAAAFPSRRVVRIAELTEGLCNAAYCVEFAGGMKSILKIASAHGEGLMTNEVNLMEAEVRAMRTVKESSAVTVPRVQYYDVSKALCSGTYFFMEALPGQSYSSLREELTEAERRAINEETGRISRRLTEIRGNRFGLLADDDHQYICLYDFVRYLFENLLADAARKAIVMDVAAGELLTGLERDRECFELVTEPTLVHWDMWDGNIFVKDGHISGIIDWERALWGEAFMDDRFRRHSINGDFLRGYGQSAFSPQEKQRIGWYDCFLYLTMMTEGAYRQYADDGQYRWARTMFARVWKELCG